MSTEIIYIDEITKEVIGSRLDVYLTKKLADLTRSEIQKLIDSGDILVNGELSSKNKKLKVGDRISVSLPEKINLEAKPEKIPLMIVYEDDDLLVVDKAKGMVVHPGAGNFSGTLVNGLLYHCDGRLSVLNGQSRAGIVHRIDKDTSGLLVVAKSDEAYIGLSKQFREHSITRAYKAIVYNNFKEDKGRIDLPIGRDERNRMKRAVTCKNSKSAVTNYSVIERFGKYTFIEARLETGRTHQIRVHMAHMKHPLLGDFFYGPKSNDFGIKGQLLHAYRLGFVHPLTGKHMEFESCLPAEFQKILDYLRKRFK